MSFDLMCINDKGCKDCKYILFTKKVIKIIEDNEFPEYAQADIIDLIEDFKNGEMENED